MEEEILNNLIEFGIKFWIKDNELHFKYPEGLEGEGKKELFKFIKSHEEGIVEILRQKNIFIIRDFADGTRL